MADSSSLLLSAIPEDSILIHPDAEDRPAVVKALFAQIVKGGHLTKAQATAAQKRVAEREAVGSTAIGNGVALPHARLGHVPSAVGAFALLRDGQGFSALDGAPVRFVFLLLTSEGDDGAHVQVLKAITQFASVPIHLKALAGCKTPKDVLSVFQDYA